MRPLLCFVIPWILMPPPLKDSLEEPLSLPPFFSTPDDPPFEEDLYPNEDFESSGPTYNPAIGFTILVE